MCTPQADEAKWKVQSLMCKVSLGSRGGPLGSGGRDGAVFGPVSQLFDLFGARGGKRHCGLEFVDDGLRLQELLRRIRGVLRRLHCRLDLRTRKSLRRRDKSVEVEIFGLDLAALQLHLVDGESLGGIGKIDEEQFVE